MNIDNRYYYFVFILKMSIRIKLNMKYTILLNIKTKINVITKNIMLKKFLSMRSKFYLNLMNHTKHSKNFWTFVKMCLSTSKNSSSNITVSSSTKQITCLCSINYSYTESKSTLNNVLTMCTWRFIMQNEWSNCVSH